MHHTNVKKRVTLATTGISNSSYSYVIIRRGKRPTSSDLEIDCDENKTFSYKRIINSPKKKKGHVILRSCDANGGIDEFIVSKSQGSEVYADARTSHWGDLWPHDKVVKQSMNAEDDGEQL